MIVLDTNVVSELLRPTPAAQVVDWVDQQPVAEVFLTAVTSAEMIYGATLLPQGRRKRGLLTNLEVLFTQQFRDRVLPFDIHAAPRYAEIVAKRRHAGLPIGMADAQIAAICRHWTMPLATRNTNDFTDTGIDLVNPWEGAQG